jgi:hypothetical protein
VLGLWVVPRFPPASPSPESRGVQFLLGLGLGLGGALVLGLITLVLLAIAFVASPAERAAILHTAGQLYAGYVGLGLAFGLVLGLAMPIAHYPLIRMMLGVLGGAAFYASAMPAARFVLVARGETPPSVGIGIVAVLVGGILLGPAVAFSVKEP